MIQLETSSGVVLSRILKDLSPITYSSSRQVNRLLDGTYHVQIIGGPAKSMEGIIISSHNQAEQLNELIDRGSALILVFGEKTYSVYIDEPIQWKRYNFANGNRDKSFFEGKIQMLIKEEVVS